MMYTDEEVAHMFWHPFGKHLLDRNTARLLDDVHTVRDDDRPADDGSAAYIVKEPSYRPYVSLSVPNDQEGYAQAEQAMRLAQSPEFLDGLRNTLPGDVLRRIVGVQSSALWAPSSTPAARGISRAGALVPSKGREAQRLWPEYRRMNPQVRDITMTMREYLAAVFTWSFPRGTGTALRDLFGSFLNFALVADFVGAGDGSGVDSRHEYFAAASEGYACLSGKAANRMAREMVIGTGLSIIKDTHRDAAERHRSPRPFPEGLTPQEFTVTRAWDGFYTPLLRIAFGTRPYRHLTDDVGTFLPALRCPHITRVLGNALRYNDVTVSWLTASATASITSL